VVFLASLSKAWLRKFTIYDLIVIALLAASGIAVKSVIGPLVRLVTGPLFIPGGAIAGGIYMMFIVLAASVTKKPSAALLCGFVQAIMVLITGMGGHHGWLTLVSYSAPGLAIGVLMVIMRHRGCCRFCCFLAGIVANVTGTFIVQAAFFQLPAVPLVLALSSAALSGGGGGILAWSLTKQINLIFKGR